jgi:phosphoserine phosphatase
MQTGREPITLSVNDFDGTLCKFSYIIAASRYLERANIGFSDFSEYAVTELKGLREGKNYDIIASDIVRRLLERLDGVPVDGVRYNLRRFVDSSGEKYVLDGARGLLDRDRKAGRQIVVVSASLYDFVEAMQTHLGQFRDILATKPEQAAGKFTRKPLNNLSTREAKRTAFVQYLLMLQDAGYRVDLKNSVGRGDRIEHDCSFMNRLGKRVVVNPAPDSVPELKKLGYETIELGGNE